MGIKGWPGVFQIRKDWTVRYTPPTMRPGLFSGLFSTPDISRIACYDNS